MSWLKVDKKSQIHLQRTDESTPTSAAPSPPDKQTRYDHVHLADAALTNLACVLDQ